MRYKSEYEGELVNMKTSLRLNLYEAKCVLYIFAFYLLTNHSFTVDDGYLPQLSLFLHLILEINIQWMYLFHLRGNCRRSDDGQVLRAQVSSRVEK